MHLTLNELSELIEAGKRLQLLDTTSPDLFRETVTKMTNYQIGNVMRGLESIRALVRVLASIEVQLIR